MLSNVPGFDAETPITDRGRLVFGAGFSFGVACTLLVLAVVLATEAGGGASIGSPVVLTVASGVVFAGVVGATLYVLSFRENRMLLPLDTERAEE